MDMDSKSVFGQLGITIASNIIALLLSLMVYYFGFTEVNIVVIYILSVLITSRYTKGYFYGIAASIISMLSFNYFFTNPLYTFNVDDSTYIFTFIVMLLAAIFTSTLTSKLIKSKELANKREEQAQILYHITSSLAKTSEVLDVATVSSKCFSNLLDCNVSCIIVNDNEETSQRIMADKDERGCNTTQINTREIKNIVSTFYTIPIEVNRKVICFICLPNQFKYNDEKRFLIDSVIMQITIAMERELLTNEKELAKKETEREKFKSNLLRAISHDLRTPLTAITGTAEMLLHSLKNDEDRKFVQAIYEDSSWLTRLVENILSLTRIQEDRLSVNIHKEVVEEIVAEAIHRTTKYNPNSKISIIIPHEVVFVRMDGKLIEQVLINLIDNAIKHTMPPDEIKVTIELEDHKVWFVVFDNGTGIKKENLSKVFDMFFVVDNSHTDSKRGIGLGLAICKAIVNYHGGEIYAENNKYGGATFRFYLNR